MNIVVFLNLIRYKNLLIIGLTQSLLKFVLLPKYIEKENLSLFQFFILTITTIIIAAAGNIYNDVIDVKTDAINKRSKQIVNYIITQQLALKWYYILNLIAIALATYLCLSINNIYLILFFLVPIALLFVYSKWLKSQVLIGNITISALISLSILMVPVFESIPLNSFTFHSIIGLSIFAFTLNLIREIIKDIEDINGDLASHLKTLPIIIGRKRTKAIVMVLSILLVITLVSFVVLEIYDIKLLNIYLIITVILPLLYFIAKLKVAKSKKEYSFLSNLLKIIMITGILSILTL